MATKKQITEEIRNHEPDFTMPKATKAELESYLTALLSGKGEDDKDEERTMAGHLAKYRKEYKPTTAASGKKSLNNGDEVANMLAGKDLDEVYTIGSEVLGIPAAELKERYAHLNPGSRRMNVGNRMRSALRNAS